MWFLRSQTKLLELPKLHSSWVKRITSAGAFDTDQELNSEKKQQQCNKSTATPCLPRVEFSHRRCKIKHKNPRILSQNSALNLVSMSIWINLDKCRVQQAAKVLLSISCLEVYMDKSREKVLSSLSCSYVMGRTYSELWVCWNARRFEPPESTAVVWGALQFKLGTAMPVLTTTMKIFHQNATDKLS